MDLSNLSNQELLQHFSQILDILKKRSVIRTRNNPVADYAEWLVSNRLGLALQSNSNSGYDAIGENGVRFQIKSRRLDPIYNSRQLGVIRKLDKKLFDFLIAVIFNKDFSVHKVMQIPNEVIAMYSRFSPHQNGHILVLRGPILEDSKTEDITRLF